MSCSREAVGANHQLPMSKAQVIIPVTVMTTQDGRLSPRPNATPRLKPNCRSMTPPEMLRVASAVSAQDLIARSSPAKSAATPRSQARRWTGERPPPARGGLVIIIIVFHEFAFPGFPSFHDGEDGDDEARERVDPGQSEERERHEAGEG